MNIKKTKFKSLRFWVISLLAASTAAFSTSLVLSSCTTTSNNNDQEIKSDVTISKQPETNQEVSADKEGGVTLAIEATSGKGKELKYQWYQNKNDNNGWQPIQGATNSSYIIPSTELKTVTTEATWEYKAEIQYKDGTDAKFESSTYAVKVKPVETPTNTISFTQDLTTSASMTAGTSKTFTVLATTNITNATMYYDWYLDKSDGSGAQKVQTGTNNTYTISETDTSSLTANATWSLYVQAYPNSNNTLIAKSSTCSISITPKTPEQPKPEVGTISFKTDLPDTKSITSGTATTFTVEAVTANINNASVYYDWYLDTGDGKYTSVQNTTTNSYTITSSSTSTITEIKNWNLYVKAYVVNNSSISVTSKTCAITINPQNSGGTTTPTETIYARNPDRLTGLTTVKYEQEKWIGDNSVSILVNSKANIPYLQTYVKDYLAKNANDKNSDDKNVSYPYTIMETLGEKLTSRKNYTPYENSVGTGWLLDYSIDKTDNNLVNYYIATNMHVIESTYIIEYTTPIEVNKETTTAKVSIKVPISKESVTDAGVYLSQPQYNTESSSYNLTVPFDHRSPAWHKTPININTINDSLINIGAYTDDGKPSVATPYAMEISYLYSLSNENFTRGFNFFFPTDKTTATKTITMANQPSYDLSVLKVSEKKGAFDNLGSDPVYTEIFKKMQTMFNVNTDDKSTTAKSSYIARLNSLLTMLNGDKYTKEEASKLFMFADYKTDLTSNTIISAAGFPAPTNDVNFNSNTLSYSLITKAASRVNRSAIEYNYQGNRYYSTYDTSHDLFLPNVSLIAGSSGSMNVTQDYKIMGIYWGVSYYYNQGITTEIFSYSNPSSILMKWLKYIQANDSGSKLNELFTGLKSKGYFS